MSCDIYFYKEASEVKSDENGTNLLYVTQKYEGIIPVPVRNEYLDLDKYMERNPYRILSSFADEIEVEEEDGTIRKIHIDDVPRHFVMEDTIPVEEIGYYRISFGRTLKTLNEDQNESDNKLYEIFELCTENSKKCDITPDFFRNVVLSKLKENGFETISKELENILNDIPETKIILIS